MFVFAYPKQAALLGRAPADAEGGGIGVDKAYASAASSRERRRLSIKAAKVRRRKQEFEILDMVAEDERSKLENQENRVSLNFFFSLFFASLQVHRQKRDFSSRVSGKDPPENHTRLFPRKNYNHAYLRAHVPLSSPLTGNCSPPPGERSLNTKETLDRGKGE